MKQRPSLKNHVAMMIYVFTIVEIRDSKQNDSQWARKDLSDSERCERFAL